MPNDVVFCVQASSTHDSDHVRPSLNAKLFLFSTDWQPFELIMYQTEQDRFNSPTAKFNSQNRIP